MGEGNGTHGTPPTSTLSHPPPAHRPLDAPTPCPSCKHAPRIPNTPQHDTARARQTTRSEEPRRAQRRELVAELARRFPPRPGAARVQPHISRIAPRLGEDPEARKNERGQRDERREQHQHAPQESRAADSSRGRGPLHTASPTPSDLAQNPRGTFQPHGDGARRDEPREQPQHASQGRRDAEPSRGRGHFPMTSAPPRNLADILATQSGPTKTTPDGTSSANRYSRQLFVGVRSACRTLVPVAPLPRDGPPIKLNLIWRRMRAAARPLQPMTVPDTEHLTLRACSNLQELETQGPGRWPRSHMHCLCRGNFCNTARRQRRGMGNTARVGKQASTSHTQSRYVQAFTRRRIVSSDATAIQRLPFCREESRLCPREHDGASLYDVIQWGERAARTLDTTLRPHSRTRGARCRARNARLCENV